MPDENYNPGKQPEYAGQAEKDKPKYEIPIGLLNEIFEKKTKELGDLLAKRFGLNAPEF